MSINSFICTHRLHTYLHGLRVRPFGNPSSKLASLLNACVDALRMARTVNIDEGEGGSTENVEPYYRFFLPCMDPPWGSFSKEKGMQIIS